MAQPDPLTIEPVGRFDATVALPGSKSLTNRAMLLAALAGGRSTLTNVLFADDTRAMMQALAALGFTLEIDEPARIVTVRGEAGRIPAGVANLFLGNAGTAMRFLTAACCLGDGDYTLDGIPRMRQRPIGELVESLRELGAAIDYVGEQGFPPLRVSAGGLAGGTVRMPAVLSSQFISALMQVGPCTANGITLEFSAPVISRPYVEMTIQIMRDFGAFVAADAEFRRVTVEPGGYRGTDLAIEPDASNASYFLAAAAITPGARCCVQGIGEGSVQGDKGFAHVLSRMGVQVRVAADSTTLVGPDRLTGLPGVDLNDMPDMAQTLAVVAMFAHGPTTIRNVGNLRVKETDRLAALKNELTKLGATVDVTGDDVTITPAAGHVYRPAAIDTYDDHRMAMSFAVAGLRIAGVEIRDPGCVNKTFPDFWDHLDRLRAAGAR